MTPQNFPLMPSRFEEDIAGPPPERDRAPLNVENEVALVGEHHEHHAPLTCSSITAVIRKARWGDPVWTRSSRSRSWRIHFQQHLEGNRGVSSIP